MRRFWQQVGTITFITCYGTIVARWPSESVIAGASAVSGVWIVALSVSSHFVGCSGVVPSRETVRSPHLSRFWPSVLFR